MPASSRSTKPAAGGTPAPAPAPAPTVDLDPNSPGNQEILQRVAGESSAGVGSQTPTLDAAAPAHGKHGKVGLNPAGLGVTVGDWNFGFKPKMSTDDSFDSSQDEEKRLRREQDEVAERQDPRPSSR